MARHGLVNVGQLVRQRHAADGAALVGFAGHRGSVLAASSWGTPEQVFPMPQARTGSHEDVLHDTLARPSVLVFSDDRSGPWLSAWMGHRGIAVVYDPEREESNYVPTRIGQRYDALIWLEQTRSLRPLHHEGRPQEPELETEPTGF